MGSSILKKWIKGAFTKPLTIIKGMYYNVTNQHKDLASYRLNICSDCKHAIIYKGQSVCEECGCILQNKVRVADEKCIMNKW